MTEILQRNLPYDPFAPRALPGIAPLRMDAWLLRDEAFAAQMARREALLSTSRNAVLALDEAARPAAVELLDLVLSHAYPGTEDTQGSVTRPDGVEVIIERSDPMGTLGRLVQEDLCILQKQGEEHVLSGAVLCFPASWMLSEKYLRPLVAIHDPVASYDGGIAKRVQRLFDGVQPERPLWRVNALWYRDPELHQPRRVDARRDKPEAGQAEYLRSERQCILRLRQTGAVVFSIHSYVLARADALQTQDRPVQ